MDIWARRIAGAGVCTFGVAMAGFGTLLGVQLFDGTASVLVSGWIAASLPIALVTGLQLSEMGTNGPEGNGSSRGELFEPEDWGMRSDRFPVYTSQSPEAG